MNKIVGTLLLIFCCATISYAQQEPLYAHAPFNPYWYNVAFAGKETAHKFRFNARQQQFQFPGMPTTYTFSYTGQFGANGIGLLASYDKIASFQKSDIGLSYTRHLKLGDKHHISIGLLGEYFNYRVILSNQLGLVDPNDVAVLNAADGVNGFDFGAGALYYNERFYIGASAVNLAESDIDLGEVNDDRNLNAKLYRQYYAMAGYKIQRPNKIVSFEPNVLVRFIPNVPVRPEVHLKTNFDLELGRLFLNVGTRIINRTDLILGFGFELEEYAFLAFSYEYAFSDLQRYGSGSFELTVGANITKVKKETKPVDIE